MARRRHLGTVLAPVAVVALLAACAPEATAQRAAEGGKTGAATQAAVAAPLAPPGVPASAFPRPKRAVAGIVSDQWGEEAHRDRSGEADTLFQAMRVAPGMDVADIGAGNGYHVRRLAKRLGPGSTVYGQDITPRYLATLSSRLAEEGIAQARAADEPGVVLVLGEPHDPRLPPASLDRVLMSHMYHEIEQPFGLLHNLAPALRPGALVAVLEIDRDTARHGTPLDQLRCEFAAVGYREVGVTRLDEGQRYVALFEPPATLPKPEAIKAC